MATIKKITKKKKRVKKYRRTFIAEFTCEVIKGEVQYKRKTLGYLLRNEIPDHSDFKLQKVLVRRHATAGKTIGDGFERRIAKTLSLWWTNGQSKSVFVRRAGSGGKKTDKIGESGYGGDIHADKAIGFPLVDLFNFELKHRKDMDPSQLFLGEQSKFLGAWSQCLVDAAITKRLPCLIYKREKITCVCFQRKVIDVLNTQVDIYDCLDSLIFCDMIIFNLDDFLGTVTPQVLWKLDKSIKKLKKKK